MELRVSEVMDAGEDRGVLTHVRLEVIVMRRATLTMYETINTP